MCNRQLGYQAMVVYWVPTIADGRVTCVHYGHCGQAVAMSSITDGNVPRIQSRIDMSANPLGLTTRAVYAV
jgi:hypothetical protein